MLSLEKYLQVFCPLFSWVVWGFFVIELFVYFGNQAVVGHVICKYFLPVRRSSFCFVCYFLCCLIRIHLFIFAYFHCLGRLTQETIGMICVRQCFACVPFAEFYGVMSSLWCLVFFLRNSFIEIYFSYCAIHPFKMYSSVVFRMFMELCIHHQSQLKTFFITPKKKICTPNYCLPNVPISPSP